MTLPKKGRSERRITHNGEIYNWVLRAIQQYIMGNHLDSGLAVMEITVGDLIAAEAPWVRERISLPPETAVIGLTDTQGEECYAVFRKDTFEMLYTGDMVWEALQFSSSQVQSFGG